MGDNRLFDLVRYQRMELHEAGLITGEEYADLLNDPRSKGAVARLETYDDMKARVDAAESRWDALRGYVDGMAVASSTGPLANRAFKAVLAKMAELEGD